MPPYTRDWGDATGSETLLAAAARHLSKLDDMSTAALGDVLVFRMRDEGVARHAGILTGTSRLVHAQEGLRVIEIELGRWWRRERKLKDGAQLKPESVMYDRIAVLLLDEVKRLSLRVSLVEGNKGDDARATA
jgi:hypothetical protein